MDDFVGREPELAMLDAQLGVVKSGRPRVVMVEGEAGVGKSSLLSRFSRRHGAVHLLRGGGEDTEMLVTYGVVDQLVASACLDVIQVPPLLRPDRPAGVDPVAVGAALVSLLGDLQGDDGTVVVAVDDLHWADHASAYALLFALRRLQVDRVLALVSTRPGELGRWGEGWARFIAGDHRATRLRLGGLVPDELVMLAEALGVGELSPRAVSNLLEHTAGNPLHCRALLEELDQGALERGSGLPAPRVLAGVVLSRLGALSEPAQALVTAAAVLGLHCRLSVAAGVAGLADPLPALEEAVAAGLVTERPGHRGADSEISFAHRMVYRAVYDDLGPTKRRRLHRAAADRVSGPDNLAHRVAATIGPDDSLAADLEAAAARAASAGQMSQAASWLAQASATSPDGAERDRRLLDAFDVMVSGGDVAGAKALLGRVADLAPSARRAALLAHLDLLCGRGAVAEERLLQAWEAHDPSSEPLVGAMTAASLSMYLITAGRGADAVMWAERALGGSISHPDQHLRVSTLLALSLTLDGRGPEGLARLGGMAEVAAETPLADSDALVARGMCRLFSDDLVGARADLSVAVARFRAGVPLALASQCGTYLADVQYRLGSWDDANAHGELAVSVAEAAERTWDFPFVHAYAALVPTARGDWEIADAHVQASWAAAHRLGAGAAVTLAATARAALGSARGEPTEVLAAISAVRALGRLEFFGFPGWFQWRPLEADALIASDRLDDADRAIEELVAAIPASGLPSAALAVARLRGVLAAARGDADAAATFFESAWQIAETLPTPFEVARLGLDDGRRLRRFGDRRGAGDRLIAAREVLVALGARPYVTACNRELAACGTRLRADEPPAAGALTPAELAVARLVAGGRSNRQVAAELYVSVKAVEFHLGHIFAKLGISSRRELADQLGRSGPSP